MYLEASRTAQCHTTCHTQTPLRIPMFLHVCRQMTGQTECMSALLTERLHIAHQGMCPDVGHLVIDVLFVNNHDTALNILRTTGWTSKRSLVYETVYFIFIDSHMITFTPLVIITLIRIRRQWAKLWKTLWLSYLEVVHSHGTRALLDDGLHLGSFFRRGLDGISSGYDGGVGCVIRHGSGRRADR
jgi:hypothetical protein